MARTPQTLEVGGSSADDLLIAGTTLITDLDMFLRVLVMVYERGEIDRDIAVTQLFNHMYACNRLICDAIKRVREHDAY